jgi:hypothetical protein
MTTILSITTFMLIALAVYGWHIRYFRKHLMVHDCCRFDNNEGRRVRGRVISIHTNMLEGGRKDVDVWVEADGKRYHRKLWEVYP